MSVEYDRPRSGPWPAEMAWVILVSSWPDLITTWILGWLASKPCTTPSIAVASRSVKKCQNSIVPSGSTAGPAEVPVEAPGVHPVASRAAARAAPRSVRRFMVVLLELDVTGVRRRGFE